MSVSLAAIFQFVLSLLCGVSGRFQVRVAALSLSCCFVLVDGHGSFPLREDGKESLLPAACLQIHQDDLKDWKGVKTLL